LSNLEKEVNHDPASLFLAFQEYENDGQKGLRFFRDSSPLAQANVTALSRARSSLLSVTLSKATGTWGSVGLNCSHAKMQSLLFKESKVIHLDFFVGILGLGQ